MTMLVHEQNVIFISASLPCVNISCSSLPSHASAQTQTQAKAKSPVVTKSQAITINNAKKTHTSELYKRRERNTGERIDFQWYMPTLVRGVSSIFRRVSAHLNIWSHWTERMSRHAQVQLVLFSLAENALVFSNQTKLSQILLPCFVFQQL